MNVYPLFKSVPNENTDNFEMLCWSELLVYKKICHVPTEIGITKEHILSNWKTLQTNNDPQVDEHTNLYE